MQNARSEKKHYIDKLNLVIIMRDTVYKTRMSKRSYIERSEEAIQPKKKCQIKTTRKGSNETELDRNYSVQPKETIQLPQIQPKKKRQRKMTAKSNDDEIQHHQHEEPQPKKKRQMKVTNKKARKTLQDSIRSVDAATLVNDLLTEEFCEGHLAAFVSELKELLIGLVVYLRNTFAMLHFKEKNSQMLFQLKWYSHCSAFLLDEKYTMDAINLEEAQHPKLASLRQQWLDFCREQAISTSERNSVMTTLSSAVYNSLLEHVQDSKSSCPIIPSIPLEEDGVYYRFGGGTLCEMLHRRYKEIRSASDKNLMSIEISLLQAINTKDKSEIPEYLQYRYCGFMYFPHKVFIAS